MRKRETLKAGCVVVDINSKKIALIYRKKKNDYEFPKGHLELNENLMQCAIRETAEEIKRDVKVCENVKPFEIIYHNKKDGRCRVYYYLAVDLKPSDNKSTDTHDLIWTDYKSVESYLTYKTGKNVWQHFYKKILDLQNLTKLMM